MIALVLIGIVMGWVGVLACRHTFRQWRVLGATAALLAAVWMLALIHDVPWWPGFGGILLGTFLHRSFLSALRSHLPSS